MTQSAGAIWLRSLVGLAMAWCAVFVQAADWYPVEVDVWDPPFNTERQRESRSYMPLTRAARRWRLCVLIPHLKDAYWLAVNYGLVAEARRLGVNLTVYEAGGYQRLEVQREQFTRCIEEQVDGVILSAISADGLSDLIEQARGRGIPTLDLINGVNSPDIAARAAVDFYDTGFQAGTYLKRLHPESSGSPGPPGSPGPIDVAWFPGPAGAAWVAEGDRGFKAALAGSPMRIVATRHGDTGKTTQARLIEEVFEELGADGIEALDYIVGTTVTAEAAVDILRRRGLAQRIKVLSYYYGPGVHRGIRRGRIIAAPTDSQAVQARMAVDMMVRLLEDKTLFKHAAPKVMVIDRRNQRRWDASTTLAPRGFRPVFSVRGQGS